MLRKHETSNLEWPIHWNKLVKYKEKCGSAQCPLALSSETTLVQLGRISRAAPAETTMARRRTRIPALAYHGINDNRHSVHRFSLL